MKRITRYFFEGLIVLLPIAASVYVIYLIFTKVDSLFDFEYPGIGILITIGVVLLTGVIASNYFTSRFVSAFEKLFSKLPIVKIVYNAFKDLIEAFVGDKRKFNKPVLFKFGDDKNVEMFGFMTEEDLSTFDESEKVAIYVPQAYNFAGHLFVVPKRNVKQLDVPAKQVMTFIVSGGLSLSDQSN